jgi:uncharacterized protein YchJ
MTEDDKQCPCGSGKIYEDCCKKEFDAANTKEKLKQAMSNPDKAKELKALMERMKKGDH